MKSLRLVWIASGAIVVLLILALALAYNSSFQTWAVRRALASHPAAGVTVGAVDAGLRHVEVKDVRVARDGVVVTIPLAEAELSVLSALLRDKVLVTRLVAKGWTLDCAKQPDASASAVAPLPPAAAVAQVFGGVFTALELPFDFALAAVQLEGDVVLPGSRGRGKITLAGGGLGAGQEGKFDLSAHLILSDQKINVLDVRGLLVAAMDSSRTFARATGKIETSARGPQLPESIKLTTEIVAARSTAGEDYSVTISTTDRQLLSVRGSLPKSGGPLDGTWKIDMRDADLAPFAFGRPLPSFSATGEGSFDAGAAFASVHGDGKLDLTADRLGVFGPALEPMGATKLAAEFDLALRGATITVEHLNATLANAERPVVQARALQAFSLDLQTRTLVAADPARELFGVDLLAVPVAWAQPFVPAELTGGYIRGELVATTRAGGVNVRSKAPIAVSTLSLRLPHSEKPELSDLDVTLNVAADYAPQGWQAEVAGFTAKHGAETVFAFDAKAGELAGNGQTVKMTGRIVANLAELARQPIARGAVALSAGEGTVEFAASMGSTRELQATIAVRGLATEVKELAGKLPAFSTALRADIAAGGQITLNVPIEIEAQGRKSDLTFAGTITQAKDSWAIDAQLTSTHFVVDDTKALVALAPAREKPRDASAPGRSGLPPWHGLSGQVVLALKRVVYSESFQASDIAGTVRMADGALKLEGIRTGLAEGSAKLDGKVSFDAKSTLPYEASVQLALADFNPGPLLRAFSPSQPPTLEGAFQVSSRLTGAAETLGALPLNLHGDFQLTSRGGVFRGLPVSVATITENTGTIAALIASAGNALSEITRRKESSEVVSKAQAVSELAKRLSAIAYDQLNVSVTREPSLGIVIKELTLISPELRLSGSGRTMHQADTRFLDDRVTLEFKLRARDQLATLLKRIGRLEEEVDELGYAACTLPLKVNGTLGRPQTGELNRALVAIALEKTGVTDKAADFVERILGK